ncbi:hypothetical protein AC579_1093 [Pseudocercospora musae]|uniref:Uncharacterized protein n=1 Tax=Pseudocercospora musae TaxID=113226 RepID=A0A139H882_9PEZI|nr:hypothetical protein AC579_1093 [Pseudocercospora musae]
MRSGLGRSIQTSRDAEAASPARDPTVLSVGKVQYLFRSELDAVEADPIIPHMSSSVRSEWEMAAMEETTPESYTET